MSYYLSIVVCGRNDNYGCDYVKRLQTLVSGVNYFCALNALSCQLVFVEWNPPTDRPTIRSVIDWGSHIGVKIVTVPGRIDSELPASHGRSGLHEFIAKNAGVRRADGQFVLCCMSDLVFSSEIFQYLGRRELCTDALYRATRINVQALPDGVAPAEAPEVCRQGVLHADMLLDSCYMSPAQLETLRQWNAIDKFGQMYRAIFGFRHDHEPLRLEAPVLRQFPKLIHVNAAGDFTLVSREGWLKLGGYLENDYRNHVDALFCFHAAKMGFAQVILPLRMCIFHQVHEEAPLLPYMETLAKLSKLGQNPKWGLSDQELSIEVIQIGEQKHAMPSAAK